MSRKPVFESLLGPEVLYYNLIYHIRNEFEKQGIKKINTELEDTVKQVIYQNVKVIEWEADTKE